MTAKHTTARRRTAAARRTGHAPPVSSGTLLRFDGRRILDPDGIVLAVLGDDDRWQTVDGVPCHGLEIPTPKAQPQVHSEDRAAATRAADSVWMEGALETIARLAATQETMTADDVWAELQMPPREPRMIGNALDRARGLGLIEATDEHRPSKRKNNNHSRPIRVWRSLTPEQPRLC
jgi:hypothetical protein